MVRSERFWLYFGRALLPILGVFRSAQEKKPSRLYYIPWLAFLPLYIIYESAINIYFFYMAFTARLENRDAFILRAYGVSTTASQNKAYSATTGTPRTTGSSSLGARRRLWQNTTTTRSSGTLVRRARRCYKRVLRYSDTPPLGSVMRKCSQPQNRNYITYHNVTSGGGGSSHGQTRRKFG